jgi:hypothetical protein
MSPSLDFEDSTASGPEPDVWGTLGTGLTLAALAFIGAGVAYSFAIEGSARDRFVVATELGASPITAGLLLAGTVALLEAARRQGRPALGGTATMGLAVAVLVVGGSLYSIWHYATVTFEPAFEGVQAADPQWRRAGFILYQLAAGVIGAGTLVILLRSNDRSVEVA